MKQRTCVIHDCYAYILPFHVSTRYNIFIGPCECQITNWALYDVAWPYLTSHWSLTVDSLWHLWHFPRNTVLYNPQTKMICTTCCHRDDQAMLRKTAKLFSAMISESVGTHTTHVDMGTCKRTINLLKAIIHGAHVLSLQWVGLE